MNLLFSVWVAKDPFWSLQKDPDQKQMDISLHKRSWRLHLLCIVDLLLHTASQDLGLGLSSVSKGYGVTQGTSLVLEVCVTGWGKNNILAFPALC